MKADSSTIKKILVLRYRSIGDIILSFPAVERLKAAYPEASIDMVIDDVFADVCYGHPHIDNVLLHRRKRGEMSRFAYFMDYLKFISGLRKRKYDLVVDFHCGPRSALTAFLTGARYRLGNLMRARNKLFYNMYPEPGTNDTHTVDVMLRTLEPLGLKAQKKKKSLYLGYNSDDEMYVRNFLEKFDVSDKDRVVMVHPGARVDIKRLPAQKMGEAVRWMTDELGVKVLYAGNDNDLPAIAEIVSYSEKPGLMATNLTLGQLAALIKSCDMFIGNDSGPMHMAAALDVPIVAFFGPSDPKVWSPWGARGKIVRCTPMPCMPCDQKNCPYLGNHCMTRIKLQDIKRAVTSTLHLKPLAHG